MTRVLSDPGLQSGQMTGSTPAGTDLAGLEIFRRAFCYLAPTYLLLLVLIFANDSLGRTFHYSIKFFSPAVYLFQSPLLSFNYYGLFLLLGMAASLLAGLKAAPLWRLTTENVLTMITYCIIFGSLGARLYYVALCWPHFMQFPQEIFKASLGGLSIHGCIAGLFMALLLYARVHGKKAVAYFDFVCICLRR